MADRMRSWQDLPDSVSFLPRTGWSWGCGGYGLRNNQRTIEFVHENGDADIYTLPDFLNEMLDFTEVQAKRNKVAEIHRALDL